MSEHLNEYMDAEHRGFHHHHDNEPPSHPCDTAGHEHHHHADGSCCCQRHEKEFHGMDPVMAARLIVSAVLYAGAMFLPVSAELGAALMLGTALIAGYDIVAQAVKNLFTGSVFDEYFLMSFAAVAACVIGEFEEGAAVMLLYRIGETAQDYAVRHSRKTIAALTSGQTGDSGFGGSEKMITKFSRIYTPAVLVMALCMALIPAFNRGVGWSDAVYRALTFLVLACPCAVVISVPLSYFAGIGAASRRGVFFRDSTALDSLAREGEGAVFESAVLGGVRCLVHGGTPDAPAVAIKTDSGADEVLAQRIARGTRRIVFENMGFVVLVKLTVLVLGALGISALWFAVFADSGIAVIAVLNSLRAFAVREGKNR